MTPIQKDALRSASQLWPGKRLYLVGATSLVVLGKLAPDRVTLDLDVAVDVLLDELAGALDDAEDWTRDPRHEQRWLFRGVAPVDLLAIGGEHLETGLLVWPATGAQMSLVGLELLAGNSQALSDRGLDDVFVPAPAVVAILKMAAWLDRPGERARDLADLAHLFDRYIMPNDERSFVGEAADRGLFGEEASIYLLGYDIGTTGSQTAAGLARRFVTRLRDHEPSLVALVQRWPTADDEDQALRRLHFLEDGLTAGAIV